MSGEIGAVRGGSSAAMADRISRGLLWRRQIAAIFGLELRKTLLRGRMLPVVLFALAPAGLWALRAFRFSLSDGRFGSTGAGELASTNAGIFQTFVLRFVVFFVCLAIFTYLGRGETLERSLHFYFLAPVERRRVFLGKYLAGVVVAGALLGASTLLQLFFAFATAATTGGSSYLFGGPGLGQAAAYFAVTLIAVAAYGAIFLGLGFAVRNPMIPAAAIFAWEWSIFFLPSLLKHVSVIFYLQALCPLPAPHQVFAIAADAPRPWLAAIELAAVAGAALALGARRFGKLEITYSSD